MVVDYFTNWIEAEVEALERITMANILKLFKSDILDRYMIP